VKRDFFRNASSSLISIIRVMSTFNQFYRTVEKIGVIIEKSVSFYITNLIIRTVREYSSTTT